jgi:type VI secretion system protein ImpK
MDSTASAAARSDTLALLCQNILTSIVRIQSGKQPLADLETFRRRMKSAIQEFEREAGAAGYGASEIREAAFAVVAFLDETILTSRDPRADEWRKWPLNNELFGQAIAGDVFFDKLTDLERGRDSTALADVLEVYTLCLLLGFEGRYAPPLRGEAYRTADRLRRRIESIRGLDYKLSPPLNLAAAPVLDEPPARADWRLWILGGAGGLILLFLIYYFSLSFRVGELESKGGEFQMTTKAARA